VRADRRSCSTIERSHLPATAQAHAYLGQSNFEQAINSLALALDIEPANREAKEILGIAEIEGGDVDKGREVSRLGTGRSICLIFERTANVLVRLSST
jgi:Tfp pilus assembly protein PilF